MSDAGVRARGLTFAVARRRAGGRARRRARVRFAGAFRGYGTIVIIDHGDGWTSLLTGLGGADGRVGDRVAPGAADRPRGERRATPRVTVELRRRGRPVDIAALIG